MVLERHVREFFGVVLDLARPSEPWCFAAGSCFFRSCLTGISSSSRRHQSCEQPQATESLDNLSLDNLSQQTTVQSCNPALTCPVLMAECPPSRAWPLIQGAWVLPCASPVPGTSEMCDALAAQCQARLTTTNSHIEQGS